MITQFVTNPFGFFCSMYIERSHLEKGPGGGGEKGFFSLLKQKQKKGTMSIFVYIYVGQISTESSKGAFINYVGQFFNLLAADSDSATKNKFFIFQIFIL